MARALQILNDPRNHDVRYQIVFPHFDPTGRCGVGISADFPDVVIVTVVNLYRGWAQVTIGPYTHVFNPTANPGEVRYGDDYETAFGETATRYFRDLVPCRVDDRGLLHLR